MTTFIALLRGINIGGHQLKMTALRDHFEGYGCLDVATYIQSGNVVFTHPARTAKAIATLEGELEALLSEACGFDVPVMLRTRPELAEVVAGNPYEVTDPTKVSVAFLQSKPAAGALEALDVSSFAPEELTLVGRTLYLKLPNGTGVSTLPAAAFKVLGTSTTTRNWRTVEKLLSMATEVG
jgi:uncharacterized protein (DUF1697 family)